jgi:hypothetical protein
MTSTSLDLSQIKTDAVASAASFRALVGVGNRDKPNGFAGIDENGNIEASVSIRRGSPEDIADIVLADGELAIIDVPESYSYLVIGDGVTAGGIAPSATRLLAESTFDVQFLASAIALNVGFIECFDSTTGNAFSIFFPPLDGESSYSFQFPTIVDFTATVAGVTIKTNSGDRSTNVFGEIVINTVDNNIKMYADGGWRTLASW